MSTRWVYLCQYMGDAKIRVVVVVVMVVMVGNTGWPTGRVEDCMRITPSTTTATVWTLATAATLVVPLAATNLKTSG